MLKVAVVGCGVWGMNYLRVFSELPDSVVVGACDQSDERLALVHKRFPSVRLFGVLQQVLYDPEIEAVVIATPATTHYEIARECLRHGKHVLVEKPITTRVEEGEELIELAEAGKLVLMVGHTFLYNSGIRKVKECMVQEEFGRVYYLHATRTNLGPIRQDVNAIWDLASHDVSIFNFLLDSQPLWVSATGARLLNNCREDVGFITLGYPDSILGNVHVSWADPNKVREVVVVGSNRRIVFDDMNNLERVKIFEKGVTPSETEVDSFGEFKLLVRDGDIVSPKVDASEPLTNQGTHFLECIERGKRPLTDGRNGVDVVRVMQAVEKSLAAGGSPVAIE
jgi:predicted dehydrogenase